MDLKILYGSEKYFRGFHETLTCVASEKVFLEQVEPAPFEKIEKYQKQLIEKNGPVYYALDGEKVIGWCDVFPFDGPRLCHRGGLGMGLLATYRRQGIGSRLLKTAISHSKSFGYEKVELYVYTSNEAAINLYKKFGFEQEGLIKRYRKLDGRYFDCLMMAKFL